MSQEADDRRRQGESRQPAKRSAGLLKRQVLGPQEGFCCVSKKKRLWQKALLQLTPKKGGVTEGRVLAKTLVVESEEDRVFKI